MEITLLLNEEDLKVLDEALVQLPFYKVDGLIAKINTQLEKQTSETSNESE